MSHFLAASPAPLKAGRTASVAVLLALSCSWWFPVRAAAHGAIDEQITALTNRIKEDPQNAVLYLKRGELH